MIWRAVAAFAILFWAVMTGLLISDVYFSDDPRFAGVPTSFILERFLQQAEADVNTFHLYHGADRIGHANLTVGSSRFSDGAVRYHWLVRGVVERLQAKSERFDITWEFTGLSNRLGEFSRMEFTASMAKQEASVNVQWSTGDKFPSVKVTRGGVGLVDTQNSGLLMALGFAGMDMKGDRDWRQIVGTLHGNSSGGGEFHFTAFEDEVVLKGRKRRCFRVTAPLPGGQMLGMVFAETGELARIDLPQDYRLIEPMIHGVILPSETTLQAQ